MSCARYQIDSVRGEGAQATRMAEEVRAALAAQPRSLPSKYFYDERGSRLFDDITALPEYYQTRTEEQLLATIAGRTRATTSPAIVARSWSSWARGRAARPACSSPPCRTRGGSSAACCWTSAGTFWRRPRARSARPFPGCAFAAWCATSRTTWLCWAPGGAGWRSSSRARSGTCTPLKCPGS